MSSNFLKNSKFLIFSIIIFLFIVTTSPAFAQIALMPQSAIIADKSLYSFGQTVSITGYSTVNSKDPVSVKIFNVDGEEVSNFSVKVLSDGYFYVSYVIPKEIQKGVYYIFANHSGIEFSNSFLIGGAISINDKYFIDSISPTKGSTPNIIDTIIVDEDFSLILNVQNLKKSDFNFAKLIQVQDSNGVTVATSFSDEFFSKSTLSQSLLTPLKLSSVGTYNIQIFFWESIDNPTAIMVPPESITINVIDAVPECNYGTTVELDQKVYTWTDKVYITIVSPCHNKDSDSIEIIGDDGQITVQTRATTIYNLRPIETGTDTGIFTGTVTLTGFTHDADGDGSIDTNPRNLVSGSTGHIMADDDDGLVVSFEFKEDETVIGSSLIRWNIGEIAWLESSYDGNGVGTIRLIDPDMNLNPKIKDSFDIDVWSDSDAGGTDITVTETNVATGIFEGTVFFNTDSYSDDSNLRVCRR